MPDSMVAAGIFSLILVLFFFLGLVLGLWISRVNNETYKKLLNAMENIMFKAMNMPNHQERQLNDQHIRHMTDEALAELERQRS